VLTGVRSRAAIALAVVSLVSIGILALVLLSPLEQRLRDDELASLERAARSARTSLSRVETEEADVRRRRLLDITRSLRRATGGDVAIVDARGRILATSDRDSPQRYPEAVRAIVTGKVQRIAADSVDGEAHVALPAPVEGIVAAVAVRKPLTESRRAAAVVRRAFLVGAAISFVLALLLGLLLARSLSRRLTGLRDTALRVAEIGPVAEMRPDAGRDEVGDLSRAFVSMQEKLREQEQARRSFVATASHELRTPLSSLQLMLDMLRADLDAEPADIADARTQAARAEAQAERLAGLASELLDLSRLDAGIAVRAEPVELGESARATVAELEVRARESGTTLVCAAPPGVWAQADPGAVDQILRILVDNALRYAPGATVRIDAVARDGHAELLVSDDGPGVAGDDRDRIFARFERGSAPAGAGFGLGLPIARELAERMEGVLALDADGAPGARFVLRLPAPR
jgi:signal transduction histidine kinase